MGSVLLTSCAGEPRSSVQVPSTGVRAVTFDLFTLFDPRGVDRRVAEVLGPGSELSATWKAKLFEYSWLRAASGQYRDFERLVDDALSFAARAHGVALSRPARERLAAAFTELEPWPDSIQVLDALRARGLLLAPLANFAPRMIEKLLAHGGMADRFDRLLSTDRARTYKPDPRAYALAEEAWGVPRRQIAFAAFGSWDAAGGQWFGFRTFWVNRLARPDEELVPIEASGPDLTALGRWIETL